MNECVDISVSYALRRLTVNECVNISVSYALRSVL